MKNIKRISLLLAIVLVLSLVFSVTAFAQDDVKPIEDNDKVFTFIPFDYELSIFFNNLSYYDKDGNYLAFCVGENKFAPKGITSLDKGQAQKVFEHFYLYDGDIERIDESFVQYELIEKRKVNGYSSYYFQGNYAFSEDELNGEYAYYFGAYMFATKENIFVVGYEDINGKTAKYEDLITAVEGIVFNGTCLEGEKPEKNANHDFSNSPAFNDVITAAQENLMGDVFEDEGMLSIVMGMIVLLTIVPTAVLIIIAIVIIVKYSKNKKELKRYELTYGSVPAYNPVQQNYGTYGYNQPVNHPYQPPASPVYQQNPIQNAPQTPSYVTNAVENLNEQVNQTQQPVQAPEAQVIENNEGVGE